MHPLNLPEINATLKKEEGKVWIFDMIRKKYIMLTPEEWVRQNFVQYLLQVKNYPATLIALEKEIKLGELKKRFDILVYDSNHQPWMMIECKAPEIKLDEKVLEQVLRYNISVPVEFIVITNGELNFAWQRSDNKLELVSELPSIK